MTQGELEQIPISVEKAFSELESQIMSDIVVRIKENGFSTATANWEISRLQQLGESEENIEKWIQDALSVTNEEMYRIFSNEVYEQYYGHSKAYELLGMHQIPYEENTELQQMVRAVRKQTCETCQSITASMGFAIQNPASGSTYYTPIKQFYRETLDSAMYGIESGAFSYQSVLEKTINTMTKSGLRWIDYDSGYHSRVNVAARRAVLTGFRQVQGKINEQTARDLHTDSYEVTYHVGARPTHQVWQGKVWTYRELQDVCGLGTVTGLHGANCYHDYNAFIPGVSVRTYTDDRLQQMMEEENTPKEYNGKRYTTYEALQQQRKMESDMRKTRQDIKLLQDGGSDDQTIMLKKARYQGQMQSYKDFSKKMNLPEQIGRVYQDGLGVKFMPSKAETRQIVNLVQEKAAAEAEKVRKSKFSERFSDYNNGQKDIITTRMLMNNLNKTEIGKETVSYIVEHPEVNIRMCYNVDHANGVLGEQFGDTVWIYASETKTVQNTAETLIHEITHHRYDIGGSQWAECVCFSQELKHRTGKTKLTGDDLRNIIKTVEELYPDLPWR